MTSVYQAAGVREDLTDVASRLEAVFESAERLGVHPREMASRVLVDVDLQRIRAQFPVQRHLSARRDEEVARALVLAIGRRARDFAYGFASWQ